VDPIVSVLILTYNHKKFINQAIQSVLTQSTNFPFEILIGDDCSTDGTCEIVNSYLEKYPDLIKAIRTDENIGALLNEKQLVKAARGKYISFLEGDDFWTQPLKLQKQVDFLENNEEYGMVHGDVNHFFEFSGKTIKQINKKMNFEVPEGFIFDKLLCLEPFFIKTATTCFRKDLIDKYFDYDLVIEKKWPLSDLALWMDISFHSKVHYMDEVFATYRLLNESSSRTKDVDLKLKYYEKLLDLKFHYVDKYHRDEKLKTEFRKQYFRNLLPMSRKIKDKEKLKELKKYFSENPNRLNRKENILLYLLKIRTFS
jgi:glycosyltransferase involved in cell wall biosynthesis